MPIIAIQREGSEADVEPLDVPLRRHCCSTSYNGRRCQRARMCTSRLQRPRAASSASCEVQQVPAPSFLSSHEVSDHQAGCPALHGTRQYTVISLCSRAPGKHPLQCAVRAIVATQPWSKVSITGLAHPKPIGHRAYTQRVCSHTMRPSA